MYNNLLLFSTSHMPPSSTRTHLPGSLEGVQGTELSTYPCLVAVTTNGVPRR